VETQQLGPEPKYAPIEMPMNSPVGIYTAFFTSVFGFAMIWHIWWIAIASLVAAFAGFVVFAWRDVHEYEVPAEEVARVDRARRQSREALLARLARQDAAS
jgi:cytochrome o ubiquinol oxidase subunit 1